jgi:hypothetical protein
MTIAGGVQDTMLEARVFETLAGALIGAAINLLILPPVLGRPRISGVDRARCQPPVEFDG